jgi:D-alanine transaminase
MPRYAYANGRFVPHSHAQVHIEDRGYQFADGVYEVVPVFEGGVVDEEPHLDRLERSLQELRIDMPMSRAALKLVSHELIRRNALTNGFIYMQVTRGVAPRDHKFPKKTPRPALTMTTRQLPRASADTLNEGFAVITAPDQRWKRCDIKSISLLPNVLAKQQAAEGGCQEAWLIDDDGKVTEGAATNAWIVTNDKKVVTRQADNAILPGITRLSLQAAMERAGYELEIRPFSREEALSATEAFLTSSTNFVMPVTRIDGQPVGNGHPGILTMQLRRIYEEQVVRDGRGAQPGDLKASIQL